MGDKSGGFGTQSGKCLIRKDFGDFGTDLHPPPPPQRPVQFTILAKSRRLDVTATMPQARQLDQAAAPAAASSWPGSPTVTAIGIFEAKNRLSELIERVTRGEEIVITRRGTQVARLMPPEAPNAQDEARALAERIRRTRAGQPLGGAVSLRELIDEGRR